MNLIERSIKRLLNTKPFYAHFFLNASVKYDMLEVPTAGAALTREGVVLVFNKDFISKLTEEEVGAIIEHEVLHILFDHIYNMHDKSLNKQCANVAMDISINQFIDHMPKEAVTLEWVNKQLKLALPKNETWEFYYHAILQKQKQLGSANSIDQHGGVASEDIPEGIKKAIIRNQIDQAVKASAGNVPNEIMQIYDSLRSEAQLPWQQILANFVSRCVSSSTQATRKKLNRRYLLEHPGKKKKRELTLGVCVDSSGSISEADYDKFMGEIVRISKTAMRTYIVEADCTVQNVESVKKNKKVPLQRKGCGGTAYQPAIDECMKLKCDAIIYFGDFDTSDTPKNPGVPFLWVGVGSSPKPGDFGAELRLK